VNRRRGLREDEATPIPGTEHMRLRLSDQPDQTWIAWLRRYAVASVDGQALELRVEGHTLVFACADRKQLAAHRQLIGSLVDQVNG
jgi:hypothetical protein